MFYNYLKVGIRNLLRYKVFSFINVFGLAVAMSVCLLLILMLADQKSYDQFHAKKDRIYRILWDKENSKAPSAATPFPLAGTLKNDYPIVEETTQLTRGVGGDVIYNQRSQEMRGYFADASFFKVFSYPLEKGNERSTLVLPNSMVITSAYAHRLFGDENPIGKTVQFVDRGGGLDSPPVNWGLYTITGVIANKNHKSHLKFDFLISSSSRKALYEENKTDDLTNRWESNQCYTYALLDPDKNGSDLTVSLNDLVRRKRDEFKDVKGFKLMAQPLTKITPGRLVSNEPSYSLPIVAYYFLSLLALVIMISACLNYTNLSIARALTRAKEIGVRKVTGAQRKDLIFQFLSESIITALLALAMAILLLIFMKPAFKALWINQYLNFDLQENIPVYFLFAGFALLIGTVAGAYPALHLSTFQPIKVLKNTDSLRPGKLGMRKVLSVSQFVISLLFITTSILIHNQFRHFVEFDYGFNAKNIVNVALQGNDYRKISNELAAVPGISTISACDYIPATGTQNGIELKVPGSEEEYKKLTLLLTSENFVDNLRIKFLAGRQLTATSDSSNRFILVNGAAAKEFGYQYPSQMIGQIVESKWGKETLEVIGVVEDFVFRHPMGGTDKIGPLVLRNQPGSFGYLNVQIASGNLMGTVAKLENKWKSIDPVHPFKYEFFDQQLAATHQGLFDVVSILGFIAFLAITIACLGLLGMATYATERRKKEVGIRKILGAEAWRIALLLSREFFSVLVISVLIGAPLSYLLNNFWLQNFPNRVEFGLGTVLSGAVILLVLGILTIGSQTIRASKRKPVDALKMD
ncbi:MAG: ABC transporter permease [Ferruginibacter sp.]|nr:ABC transporter permease [Cytophagales bacterium]